MTRDRLMMGVALLALTASLVWAGQRIPVPSIGFPGLITMSVNSGVGPESMESVASGEERLIHKFERRRRCKSFKVKHSVSRMEPVPTAPPAPEI